MSVVLTVVPNVGEADVIASLLRSEGIQCAYLNPPWHAGGEPIVGMRIEIRVDETDYERARELIENDTLE